MISNAVNTQASMLLQMSLDACRCPPCQPYSAFSSIFSAHVNGAIGRPNARDYTVACTKGAAASHPCVARLLDAGKVGSAQLLQQSETQAKLSEAERSQVPTSLPLMGVCALLTAVSLPSFCCVRLHGQKPAVLAPPL